MSEAVPISNAKPGCCCHASPCPGRRFARRVRNTGLLEEGFGQRRKVTSCDTRHERNFSVLQVGEFPGRGQPAHRRASRRETQHVVVDARQFEADAVVVVALKALGAKPVRVIAKRLDMIDQRVASLFTVVFQKDDRAVSGNQTGRPVQNGNLMPLRINL